MKAKVLLNGRERQFEMAGSSGSELKLVLSCQEGNAQWEGVSAVEVQPGVYSVLLDGRSFRASVESDNGHRYVSVGGLRVRVEVEDPRQPRRSSAQVMPEGRFRLTASMPGKVIRVLVAEGDSVEPNQGLVVVEAMKMQNELRSPKTGTVVSLPVKEGDTLSTGDLVAVVE